MPASLTCLIPGMMPSPDGVRRIRSTFLAMKSWRTATSLARVAPAAVSQVVFEAEPLRAVVESGLEVGVEGNREVGDRDADLLAAHRFRRTGIRGRCGGRRTRYILGDRTASPQIRCGKCAESKAGGSAKRLSAGDSRHSDVVRAHGLRSLRHIKSQKMPSAESDTCPATRAELSVWGGFSHCTFSMSTNIGAGNRSRIGPVQRLATGINSRSASAIARHSLDSPSKDGGRAGAGSV